MLNKSLKLFGFTCIFGVFGAFFRWLQNITAFEAETGLAISGARWSIVMLVYMVLMAAVLFVYVRKLKTCAFPTEYSSAFNTPTPIFDIAAYILAGAMAFGGLMTLFSAVTPPYAIFELITGLFAIVVAICLVAFLRSTKRDHAETRGAGASLVVDLFMCFWLIASYKTFASDPVVWHYAPRLIAICACVLAFYYLAGYPYRKPKPLQTVFFSNLAAFLFIITLADNYSFGKQLMALSCAGTLSLYSILLVCNAKENEK